MTKAELQKNVADGENLTGEFKRCETALSNGVFETVCASANTPSLQNIRLNQTVEDKQ
jgi:predicted HTH transcriptional regulator